MKKLLFVCTGNSHRSILAESVVNKYHKDKFAGYSAGSKPSGKINEDVKKFLEKNKNYDLNDYKSENFEIYINNKIKMDHVITVCNNANNEICPIWPKQNQIIHWDIDDPVSKLKNLNDEEKQIIIRKTFNEINKKINSWVKSEK